MSYQSLLVHLDVRASNENLLRATGHLADRFNAAVIGVAACQPTQVIYNDGYGMAAIDVCEAELEREIRVAETEFRNILHNRAKSLDFRAEITLAPLADYVARQSRNADLVIAAPGRAEALFDPRRHADLGDLLMQAGRPLLVVPTGQTEIKLNNILICWKDTRETRRAVLDALPMLKRATQVTVVEIAETEDAADTARHLADIVTWLGRHGIAADSAAPPATGDDVAQLNDIATDRAIDLIVAGGYGHSRMREWILGGVTRDFLMNPDRCALLSH